MLDRFVQMNGRYTLGKPIVGVQIGTTARTTLPIGASVEVRQDVQPELVQVKWQQRDFMVHLADLLAACRVEDVGEITWPEGWKTSSAESD